MHRQVSSPAVDISVLVPVLNEGATIVEVVRAMGAQRFDGTIELLFADGRSTDDTVAQLEELRRTDPRIRVLDNPRRGVASGLNVCLRTARGRYVARMDGHALYPPTYLQDGVERLMRSESGAPKCRESGRMDRTEGESGKVAWVAGPQVPVLRGGPVAAAIVAALGTRMGQGGSRRWPGAHSDADEYELDTGVFCGVWRREDVLAKGGWDEDWLCNEDSELAARFLEAGQRIVGLPDMAAGYFPRSSLPALWHQYRAYGVYRAKTALRHPGSLRRSAVLPPLLVLDAAASVVAPRRIRRLALWGLGAYVIVLLAAAVEAVRGSGCETAVGEAANSEAGDGESRNGKFGGGESGGARPGSEGVGERKASHKTDYALIPAVLVTMHAAHGVGFLVGCVKWGVPWRALRLLAGGGGKPEPYSGPIEAPSLTGEQR